MGDAGIVRYPGTLLDPRAQEFTPTTNHFPLFPPLFYPLPYHNQPPPVEIPLLPFCDPLLPFPPFPAPPARAEPPLPPSLPPPSMTPSRTLLLSSVRTDVSESTVRRDLEVFGDVRTVEMERAREGIVTVHFYDLRHAQTALLEIQEQHMQQQCRLWKHYDSLLMHNSFFEPANFPAPLPPPAQGLISGRPVWAQFLIPVTVEYPEGYNQGTIVLFNVDSQVPNNYLQHIFQDFGSIKEVRETPFKRHQRFIEFYDTREAATALAEMNGKEILGKHLVIEFSRPGGHNNRRIYKATHNDNNNKLDFAPNHSTRSSRCVVASSPLSEKRSPGYVLPHHCLGSNNPNVVRGCGSSWTTNSGATIVEGAMASLRFNGGDVVEASNNCSGYRTHKKNTKKSLNSMSSGASSLIKKQAHQQQTSSKCGGVSKLWKGGRNSKEYDPAFLIKEDAIMVSNCSDTRTTVMIKNIPNKYSQKLLLNMLDNHCIHCNEQIAHGDDQPLSSYDFVYLPIDFINKCNVGYGFVNMTSPEATLRLYKSFHLQNWEVFNSRKICQVTYARLQGLEALKEHFRSSKFPCESEAYMPVVFWPPRDGRTLTHPVPIVAINNMNTIAHPAHTTSKEDEEEGAEEDDCCFSSEEASVNIDDEEDEVIRGRGVLHEDISPKKEIKKVRSGCNVKPTLVMM